MEKHMDIVGELQDAMHEESALYAPRTSRAIEAMREAKAEIERLMLANDICWKEIEQLRADLESGMERFYSQMAELDNAKADNERLRAENAKMVTAFQEIDRRSKCDLAAEIAQRFIPYYPHL